MIYNLEEEWAIIHISKTAGCSIRDCLLKTKPNTHSYPFATKSKEYFKDIQLGHQTASFFKTIPLFCKLRYHAVCRNPFSRAVSIFLFKTSDEYVNTLKMFNGNESVDELLSLKEKGFYHFLTSDFFKEEKTQASWVDEDVNMWRFERLSEFEKVFDITLPTKNASSYTQPWRDYYDDQCKAIVKDVFEEDFLKFDYSMKF